MTAHYQGRKNWEKLKADTRAWALTQTMTSRCAFCDWQQTGAAQQVLEQYRQHRDDKHPETIVAKKRRRAA